MKKINKVNKNELAVDVNDDDMMVSLGIRNPMRVPRDPSIWSKTNKEKEFLKHMKHTCTTTLINGWPAPVNGKSIPVYSKLIVYTKGKQGKSTYSYNCGQSDISRIIAKHQGDIIKYSWNGKTYSPEELPFWFGE